MNRIAIVTNEIKDKDLLFAKKIRDSIEKKYPDVQVSITEMNEVSKNTIGQAKCIMVLGGDGTMLRVAKDTIDFDIPLIGINLGAVGFLAEVEQNNIDEAIKLLIADEYNLETRMMLEGSVVREGQVIKKQVALNDVVLSRRGDLQLIGYRVLVNGTYLNDFYADGIILSTPTGSTGYNMSAGGSIVEPMAILIMLTPVCPHTLSTRSIVLSASDKVEVMILPPKGNKESEVGAYFDGGQSEIISQGDSVIIEKSAKSIKLCRLSSQSFLEILQKKMNE